MKKKKLKSLSLNKQSVSTLNGVNGGVDAVGVSIQVTITLITKVFSFCPHVSCNTCQLSACNDATCVRTLCNDLTCESCV